MLRADSFADELLAYSERERRNAQPIDTGYLSDVYDALNYLDTYCGFPVGIDAMDEEERIAYVAGYAVPLIRAGVFRTAIKEGAVRYCAKHMEFPKSPSVLVPFCEAAMRDREPFSEGLKALPMDASGPVTPETRNRYRRAFGEREVA